MDNSKRGAFSSRLGFIAAAAGSAVGLGNIWKFPYVAGESGGAAFLIIYLLCAFLICMPIMVGEISLGRHARLNPYGTFRDIGGHRSWGIIGLVGILCGIMILSFYNVVAGWSFGYFIQISFGRLLEQPDFAGYFDHYVSNIGNNFIYSLAFMMVTAFIVVGGVQKGIERWTKLLMPLLLMLIIGLIIFALTLENAMKGIEFYLVPDFSKINLETFFKALAQAFFSLSLGMGAIITYGSYFSKKDNIITSAALVTTADACIAFLAGLLVFPLVFYQGVGPAEGPGLVFVTLPAIFEEMGPLVGKIVGGSFFLLLCFAALTSTISLLEVPVAYITDEFKFTRKPTVIVLAALIFVLGLPSMFSQGALDLFTGFISYAGEQQDFMTFIIAIFSDVGLPLGGFLISLFVAYKWHIKNFSKEIEFGHSKFKGSVQEKFVTLMLGFVSPVVVGVILLSTVLQKFFGIALF